MSKEYNHLKVEKKWQKEWERKKAFNLQSNSKSKKFYSLMEFPYPSGDGLHTGHVRGYTAMDIISHKRRSEGYNVLFPIGWDAFGLPTENYAIKTGTPPEVVTKRNTDNFRKQFKSLGMSFDWSREINTTDPKYYKWTQWIFLQLLKNDLAYKTKMTVNWCPKDKTGLANEEVVNGCCERCGTPVEKREKEQWMLKITKYADRLDKDLDLVDYLEKIKLQQRNWIGRSEGAEIDFEVWRSAEKIKVFTTRPDTIFGGTYIVLAPEHPLIQKLWDQIENKDEVSTYIDEVKNKTDIERTSEDKEKTGVRVKGISAVNPANKDVIPVYIADFVLMHYGTGAVFADAHDERDFQFAKKYGIPLKTTLKPKDGSDDSDIRSLKRCFSDTGILYDSEEFSGLTSEMAIPKMAKKYGKLVTKYKLRDWVFSRQRYWGEPIPVINCGFCGYVPVPENQLPVKLPKVKNYTPRDDGESPLASISSWVNTACPKCKRKAKKETDTMPNWAGSSWYFLRYIDPKNNSKLADPKKLKKMMPVDWYNGGMEHTTLHLLYSRFWHKFLNDIKVVPGTEPYKKRTSHGLILAKGGEKMSKSKGNVINPNETIKLYGADTLRLYEMFMGPFDQPIAWNEDNIFGVRRFIERVWRISEKVSPKARIEEKFEILLNKTIKKVSEDIESMSFNTAVSSMMILLNEMERIGSVKKGHFEIFLKILSPFAPHVTEELWHELGHKTLLVKEKWPKWNPKKLIENEIKIGVQINSRVRAEIVIPNGAKEGEAVRLARLNPDVEKWLLGKEIKKVIYVSNKILNFVV